MLSEKRDRVTLDGAWVKIDYNPEYFCSFIKLSI